MSIDEVTLYNLYNSAGRTSSSVWAAIEEVKYANAYHLWKDHGKKQYEACRQAGVRVKLFRQWLKDKEALDG